VKGGRVVKGVRFEGHADMGDPAVLARHYCDDGADEIVIYDIAASAENRTIDYEWLSATARSIDIPLCVAGGIRTVDQAVACLQNGADKISINSPALARPDLVDEIAAVAGSQCVVVGVDSRLVNGDWRVFQYTGDSARVRETPRLMRDWIIEAQDRGAGEIVLNCMDKDGVRDGYDVEQIGAARALLKIPLVASGGAGSSRHFVDLFKETNVSGALAAGIFHTGKATVRDVKRDLVKAGVEVRP
jgi:cyclase